MQDVLKAICWGFQYPGLEFLRQSVKYTKTVQMVLIGFINRSWGQKLGFQNAILKHLLV